MFYAMFLFVYSTTVTTTAMRQPHPHRPHLGHPSTTTRSTAPNISKPVTHYKLEPVRSKNLASLPILPFSSLGLTLVCSVYISQMSKNIPLLERASTSYIQSMC